MRNPFSKRLLLALVLAGGLSLSASGQTVTFNVSNVSVQKAMNKFHRQTGYSFVFAADDVDVSRVVSVHGNKAKLSNVINQILDGQNVSYTVEGKRIVVTPQQQQEKTTVKTSTPHQGNTKKIKGRVVDEKGEPIVGATVRVKGASEGTITDLDGNYSLSVPANSELEISYVGFTTQQLNVGNKQQLNVTLREDNKELNEVVVVGYGTQRKVSLTSAVGSIKGENLNKIANGTVASLQGDIPGLTILDKGGSPGRASTTMRIRGITTLNNSDALILVDGVEQRLSDVNPDDIDNISILKDAAATAIYGSRAANGIVLVTTKRAKTGAIDINLNAYVGTHNVTNKLKHMDDVTYMRQQNQAFINNGGKARYSEDFINQWIENHDSDPITYRSANQWQDAVYKTGFEQNYALNVSGGTEKARATMSLRYNDNKGVVDNFNSQIKEIRVNTDFAPYKFLKLSADADFRTNYSVIPTGAYDYDNAGGGVFYSMLHATQFVVPQYPDGSYGLGNKNANPLMLARLNGLDKQWDNLFVGNLKAEFMFLKDFKFTAQFSQRYNFYKQNVFYNKYTVSDTQFMDWGATAKDGTYNPNPNRKRTRNITRNQLTDYRRDIDEYTLNLLLDYKHSFGLHSLEMLAGFSQIRNKWSHNQAVRYDFYNNEVQSINMGSKENMEAYGYNLNFRLICSDNTHSKANYL